MAIVLSFPRVTDRLLRASEQCAYRFEEANGLNSQVSSKNSQMAYKLLPYNRFCGIIPMRLGSDSPTP